MARHDLTSRLLPWLVLPAIAGLAGFGLARESSVARPAAWAGDDRGGGGARRSGRGARERLAPPDVLLITTDDLRADAVGRGSGRGDAPSMPALLRLARAGTRYTEAFAPGGRTDGSLAVILGRRSAPGGGPGPTDTGLAQVLAASGYATTAIVAGGSVPDETLVGFRQVHADLPESPEAVARWLEGHAAELTDHRPWLLWIHWAGESESRAAYRTHAAGFDRVVDAALETLPVGDDTVVAAVATRGFALGEGGELGAGTSLSAAQTRVPLIIAGPVDQPAGQVARGPVGLDALPATVADLAGARGSALPGGSLLRSGRLAPPRRRSVVSSLGSEAGTDRALALGRWRLVEGRGGRPSTLHEASAPPGDCPDLAARHPEELAWMVEHLRDVVRMETP